MGKERIVSLVIMLEEETHDGISGKIKNREAAKVRKGSQKDKLRNEGGVSEM